MASEQDMFAQQLLNSGPPENVEENAVHFIHIKKLHWITILQDNLTSAKRYVKD